MNLIRVMPAEEVDMRQAAKLRSLSQFAPNSQRNTASRQTAN
jgi:hypothetical protein